HDLAVLSREKLVVLVPLEDRSDVDRELVAAIGNAAAEDRFELWVLVERVVREERLMRTIPAPGMDVVRALRLGHPGQPFGQSSGERVAAALDLGRPHVVAP